MSEKSKKASSEKSKKNNTSLTKDEKKQLKLAKKKEKKEAIAALSPKEKKKRKLKIAIKVIVIVLVVLAILYFAGMFILEKLMEKEPVKQIDEKYTTLNFESVPEQSKWAEIDIFSEPDYLTLDYNPSFTSDSLKGTFLLKDIPEANKTEAHKFFEKYFTMLQKGNHSIYPSLFSQKYKDNPKGFEKDVNREFPPQRIFNANVKEHARQSVVIDEKNCIIGFYEVSYLIYKNDGLFREDIGRDMDLEQEFARPLFFELLTENPGTAKEKTYINNMYTESSIIAQNKEE